MKIQRLFKRIIASAFALPLLFSAAFPVSAADTASFLQDAEWNAFVEEKIELDHPPGLAVAAVKGAEVGYRSWGYANIEEQTPVTEDTVFGIGSCSKAFTALSVLLLQEEGKLSIDDSVSTYLPWWNVTWQGQPQDLCLYPAACRS